MENGGIIGVLKAAERFFTRKLTPEKRAEILAELSEKEDAVKRGMWVSSRFNPSWTRSKTYDDDMSPQDILVAQRKLPLSAASDKALVHIRRLARIVEKNDQRRVHLASIHSS